MSIKTNRRYYEALAIVSKPRFYKTMTEAMESLPEFLQDVYEDIATDFETVPHGDHIRAVVIDHRSWAEASGVPVYEAAHWIQRIVNTCVLITAEDDNGETLTGYRPIMMIEHVQLDDRGQPYRMALSIPTYGEVVP